MYFIKESRDSRIFRAMVCFYQPGTGHPVPFTTFILVDCLPVVCTTCPLSQVQQRTLNNNQATGLHTYRCHCTNLLLVSYYKFRKLLEFSQTAMVSLQWVPLCSAYYFFCVRGIPVSSPALNIRQSLKYISRSKPTSLYVPTFQ